MLRDNYNFNPYSSNDDYTQASGHVSNCINWLDEHLDTYLEKNNIELKKQMIGYKIKQFKGLDQDNKDLADLMKKIVHLRNAFQHGKPDPVGNQLYIMYKGERIKLENELMQRFQKDYNTVYNWLISQL